MPTTDRLRSAAQLVRKVPPRVRARLRAMGIDLANQALALAFAEGVRVADALHAEDERAARRGCASAQ